ncbi:hypothetical protein NDU88_001810 [Pleurodeles waltl]|uniref:Uncharacterized protein n=1 Tax=Pleurodeles waltl TaxID=8319 RepID=A0AAV7NGT4_PLEWA|nr:hypothetical protein NDU88_001810 [Pleurodeles waltl]
MASGAWVNKASDVAQGAGVGVIVSNLGLVASEVKQGRRVAAKIPFRVADLKTSGGPVPIDPRTATGPRPGGWGTLH